MRGVVGQSKVFHSSWIEHLVLEYFSSHFMRAWALFVPLLQSRIILFFTKKSYNFQPFKDYSHVI